MPDPQLERIGKYSKMTAYFLGFLCFILIVYILMALKVILVPVTIAIFLTYLFHPILVYLKQYKVPKAVSVIIIFIGILGVYYLFGFLFVSNLDLFKSKAEFYSKNFATYLKNFLDQFDLTTQEFAQLMNIKIRRFDFNSLLQGLFAAGVIQGIFNSLASAFEDLFISMIFWIFMIMGKDKFEERLKSAFVDNGEMIYSNIVEFDNQIQSYLLVKTVLSIILATFTYIILLLFNIDFALFWAILAFILNFIPNLGSLLATLFPVAISLLQYGFGARTLIMALILIVMHNAVGNFIEPQYMGRRMDLSPVFVLFSLIFWGWVWGVAGMFLAVPIAAAMKVLFSNIKPLKPIAILMGSNTSESYTIFKSRFIKVK
ncbi:MAG TPA: AI-2E family transporter [Ignavibacteriaceae bacterium]|nr:AI-2E family transporter [Ignavibacteriaceae bacterium]